MTTLLLIDATLHTPPPADHHAYWATYDVPENAFSIPALVDRDAEELRREYLAWVNDLGDMVINGRCIRSHLRLLPDFSFWWMTLIAEKEPLKSESIHVVFKMRALEKLCDQLQSTAVTYAGRDRAVHETLSAWCRASQRHYQWIETGVRRHSTQSWRRRALPHVVQAIGYLALEWFRRYRIARPARFKAPASHGDEVTIVTFFPNVDMERTRAGRFWSRYWEKLHELLDQLPLTVNWLWIHVDSEQARFREALRLRDVCNQRDPGKYRHFIVDEFMSLGCVLRALGYYAFLCWKGLRLRAVKEGFHFAGSTLNFYPVVRRDWRASLSGIIAMNGALFMAALAAAAERLPVRPWGMFIWENQPWELMLMCAWRRRSPSATLIGYQHSALRFLELRSFADPREYRQKGPDARPVPDVLVVNGSGAFNLMRESGFPEERLYEAEAIRYLDLPKRPSKQQHRTPRTLLLVTGYLPREVQFHIALVERIARSGDWPSIGNVLVKPHPFFPVEPLLASGVTFKYEVVKRPLAELWGQVDLAFVANSTSAVLEAMYQGVPVAVCAPDDSMNLSPAFKRLPVPIIAIASQLETFLRSEEVVLPPEGYFILDEQMPRWRALLDIRVDAILKRQMDV